MDDTFELIKKVAEWLDSLGVNPVKVAGIIFLMWGIKSADKRKKLKPFYVLMTMIPGSIVCLITDKFSVNTWVLDTIVHSAAASFSYAIWAAVWKDRKKEK